MRYQELFQCLKGVGIFDLSSMALPVNCTEYALQPICCRKEKLDQNVVSMLTEARNMHPESFLTFFHATTGRTSSWLTESVANDDTRILFTLRRTEAQLPYGYMGLAYGNSDGSRIEGDAIVRFARQVEPGLMRRAFLKMVAWANSCLGIEQVWVRVLSDNPAAAFYSKCGFHEIFKAPLYEVRSASGSLIALTESPGEEDLTRSPRTITHMRFATASICGPSTNQFPQPFGTEAND